MSKTHRLNQPGWSTPSQRASSTYAIFLTIVVRNAPASLAVLLLEAGGETPVLAVSGAFSEAIRRRISSLHRGVRCWRTNPALRPDLISVP